MTSVQCVVCKNKFNITPMKNSTVNYEEELKCFNCFVDESMDIAEKMNAERIANNVVKKEIRVYDLHSAGLEYKEFVSRLKAVWNNVSVKVVAKPLEGVEGRESVKEIDANAPHSQFGVITFEGFVSRVQNVWPNAHFTVHIAKVEEGV